MKRGLALLLGVAAAAMALWGVVIRPSRPPDNSRD